MSKEEVLNIMLESFVNDNKMMAMGSGMAEEEIEKFMERSLPSIEYMLSNVYDLLVEKQIIK